MQIDDPLKKRGRPKRIRMEVMMLNFKRGNLFKDLAQDRQEWRNRIHVACYSPI